jgi:hypothetical protein
MQRLAMLVCWNEMSGCIMLQVQTVYCFGKEKTSPILLFQNYEAQSEPL